MSGTSPQPAHPTNPLSCAEVAPYLSAFADGELAEPLHTQVAVHVATCDECSQKVAHYAAIDAALASLPRTAPSPEVFERIAAAVAQRPSDPTVRESLAARPRRRVESAVWSPADVPPAAAPPPARAPRWARVSSGILPTVAAVLLITLAVLAFRGIATSIAPPGNVATPTPGPSANPVALTKAKVDAAVAASPIRLAFTPVLPSYLPPNVAQVSAAIGATQGAVSLAYLDVTWTLTGTGPVQTLHLREAPKLGQLIGYNVQRGAPDLRWQVGAYPWISAVVVDSPDDPAIEEDRDVLVLALNGHLRANASLRDAKSVLRLVSLSLDQPYQPLQVIPAQVADRVLHYTAQLQPPSGGAYTKEVYVYPAQHEQRVELRRADGSGYYTDIAQGDQGIRLDPSGKTYAQLALAQMGGSADLSRDPATQYFFGADSLVRDGVLWNTGLDPNNASQYDLLLVDAPNITHVYVDTQTKQVVRVVIEGGDTHPGGPSANSFLVANGGCTRYTLIEYLPSSAASGVTFTTTPPGDYASGGVPQTISC
jgi:anti-sigma factor RsiW